MDLAVAVIIGAAFNKIVSSLVNDIIMPLITCLLGANSLSGLSIPLKYGVVNGETVPTLTWNYGNFLQTIIEFLIIAFSIFVALKIMMKAQSLTKELGNKVKTFSKKEIKKLKKQGLTDEEINDIKTANEQNVVAEVKPLKPTTEELLTEILTVLKEKTPLKTDEKTEKQ